MYSSLLCFHSARDVRFFDRVKERHREGFLFCGFRPFYFLYNLVSPSVSFIFSYGRLGGIQYHQSFDCVRKMGLSIQRTPLRSPSSDSVQCDGTLPLPCLLTLTFSALPTCCCRVSSLCCSFSLSRCVSIIFLATSLAFSICCNA